MAERKGTAGSTSGMNVDIDIVRELAELLADTGLTEIEVEDGDRKVRVARGGFAAAAAPMVDAGSPGTRARYDSLTRSDLLTYKQMPTPTPTATAATVVDATRPVDPSLVMPAPFALCVLSVLCRGLTCVIPLANALDFTNLSCNTIFVCVCCCRCIIFMMHKSSPTRPFLDAYWCIYAYTRPLYPTHLHEEASAQARVDSPAEKPSGTKPTGLGTRTGS